MDIVVVGSLALDSVATPWGEADDMLGGSASYFSVAASYYAPVHLVAVAGQDLPARATEIFGARGVDLAGLERVEGKTFRWGGRYHENMNQRDTLFTHLNVFEHFHPKLPESYRNSELVFLANIHPSLQLEVLDQVDQPELVAMDTMNLWIETARDDLKKVLEHVDLLFLNDEEARQLSGHDQLWPAVEAVRAMGPQWVVVKKGEHGAVLFADEERFAVPAVLLEKVFDPTGAGDTFAGGFLGHLARSRRHGELDMEVLRECMIQGTVMASFVTEQFGVDRIVDLSAGEIAARRAQLAELVRWPSSAPDGTLALD